MKKTFTAVWGLLTIALVVYYVASFSHMIRLEQAFGDNILQSTIVAIGVDILGVASWWAIKSIREAMHVRLLGRIFCSVLLLVIVAYTVVFNVIAGIAVK